MTGSGEYRELVLAKGRDWDFPDSEWETKAVDEIMAMADEAVIVTRVPVAQLEWMRMPAGQCHANAGWYAERDPRATMVTGWWVQFPSFVLHSVVRIGNEYLCVTPTPFDEGGFHFIPDAKIEWRDTGNVRTAFRDGQAIGPGLRRHPSFTRAQNALVRERILAGVPLEEAIEFSDEEMAGMKAAHIPNG